MADGVLGVFRACAQRAVRPGPRRRAAQGAGCGGHGPAGNDPVRQDVGRRDGRLVPEGRDGDGDRGARERREGAAQPCAGHVAGAGARRGEFAPPRGRHRRGGARVPGPRRRLGAARLPGAARGRRRRCYSPGDGGSTQRRLLRPQGWLPGGAPLRRRQLQPPGRRRRHAAPAGRGGRAGATSLGRSGGAARGSLSRLPAEAAQRPAGGVLRALRRAFLASARRGPVKFWFTARSVFGAASGPPSGGIGGSGIPQQSPRTKQAPRTCRKNG